MVNPAAAERAAAIVQARYPDAEVTVGSTFDGGHIDVRGETFSLRLTIGHEDSLLLTAFGPDPGNEAEP